MVAANSLLTGDLAEPFAFFQILIKTDHKKGLNHNIIANYIWHPVNYQIKINYFTVSN